MLDSTDGHPSHWSLPPTALSPSTSFSVANPSGQDSQVNMLTDQISHMQKTMNEMRQYQDELKVLLPSELKMLLREFKEQDLQGSRLHQGELRDFIQQELKGLKASLASDFQASTDGSCVKDFIQQQLQGLKVSLAAEVQASKDGSCSKEFVQQEIQGLKVLLASELRDSRDVSCTKVEDVRALLEDFWSKRGGSWPSAPDTSGAADNTGIKQEVSNLQVDSVFTEQEKEADKLWSEFTVDVEQTDASCTYKRVFDSIMSNRSFWHELFERCGCLNMIWTRRPRNRITEFTDTQLFSLVQTMAILFNTGIMIHETDLEIKAELRQPRGHVPKWLDTCNQVFNIIFAIELVVRIAAERSWFFVDPPEWAWNMFDLVLVTVCLVFDIFSDTQLSFLRTVRIIRVFRVLRIIRVLRFFRQLRQMLYSILACLASLVWAFVFLAATMAMFSLVCMQGSADILQQESSGGEAIILSNGQSLRDEIEKWFGSFTGSMFSLGASVTGGTDWADVWEPLTFGGPLYSSAFVAYVVFVIVGVMNVLTGVFLNGAHEFVDVDLIVQNEQVEVEQFCHQVISLFTQIDEMALGRIDWHTFHSALQRPDFQAYFRSLGLEPTHIRLVFDLFDKDRKDEIEMEDFVMGLVRLKGAATAIDARIIQREVAMLPLETTKKLASTGILR